MVTDIKSPIKIVPIILALIFIIGYSIFEARGVILGPVIKISGPENGSGFETSLVEITGEAKNISFINLNGDPLEISDRGQFREKLLLSPGLNIMKFEAEDRFGRETVKYLELFLKT